MPDNPETVGAQFDKMKIVRHQNDRTPIGIDCVDQGLPRLHVKMVGRFVQQQQVRCIPGYAGKEELCQLTAGQGCGCGIRPFAGDSEPAELRPYLCFGCVRQAQPEFLHRRPCRIERFRLLLREIADAQLA